jgi:hypothetical protein
MNANNPNPMDMPAFRVAGKWATSRSAQDQDQINKLAGEFFSEKELAVLQELLYGKVAMDGTTNDQKYKLTFSGDEAQALLTKGDPNQLMGLTTNPGEQSDTPYLQFYDFCFTIDYLKNAMRGMFIKLNSRLSNKDSFKHSAKTIQFRDGVPFEFRKFLFRLRDQALQGGNVPERLSLKYYTTTEPFYNLRGNSTSKDLYMKAYDEAYNLQSVLINALQALSQGLFTVHACRAKKLHLHDNVNRDKLISEDEFIGEQEWINTFDVTSQIIYNVNNGNIDTAIYTSLPDGFDKNVVQLLQPKVTGTKYYDVRRSSFEWVAEHNEIRIDNDKDLRDELFAGKLPLDNAHRRLPYGNLYATKTISGGAIPKYLAHYVNQVQPALIDPPLTLELKPSYLKPRFEYLSHHPIHACHKLAVAYQSSQMLHNIISMYISLQQALEAAESALKQEGTESDRMFGMDDLKMVTRAGIAPTCGPDMVPQFYRERVNDQGKTLFEPISEVEAYNVRDGGVELASHVSREKWDCVPRVTIGQMAKQTMATDMDFRPVVVNTGIRDSITQRVPRVEMITPGNIRKAVEARGGFETASEQMLGSGISGEMQAYLVPKDMLAALNMI